MNNWIIEGRGLTGKAWDNIRCYRKVQFNIYNILPFTVPKIKEVTVWGLKDETQVVEGPLISMSSFVLVYVKDGSVLSIRSGPLSVISQLIFYRDFKVYHYHYDSFLRRPSLTILVPDTPVPPENSSAPWSLLWRVSLGDTVVTPPFSPSWLRVTSSKHY